MEKQRGKLPGLARFALLQVTASVLAMLSLISGVHGQGDGLLSESGHRLFPIGFHELPKNDADLKTMAESGINLVRCHSKEDLDRVGAMGMMGWIPLRVQLGASKELHELVQSVVDHPALAIWEGPDEIVWQFTACSALKSKAGIRRSDWWQQTPKAVGYSENQARKIIPRLCAGIELVRSLDGQNHQFWINEARRSDVKFVRQYLNWVDITGCDDYPIKKDSSPDAVRRVGSSVERWKQIGRGKPVWMVLQAFSWSELAKGSDVAAATYPTFAQSRFMAYDVIVHGARGILYWGTHYLKSQAFRESLYALTSELAALQPFLVAPEDKRPRVTLIEANDGEQRFGVKMTVRRVSRDCLIVLVNEDDRRHMGVEVTGLHYLNGQSLELLYGTEHVTVENGEFITRMQSLEVKVFATSCQWESKQRKGRDFRR